MVQNRPKEAALRRLEFPFPERASELFECRSVETRGCGVFMVQCSDNDGDFHGDFQKVIF